MEGQEPKDRGSEGTPAQAVPQNQPEEQILAWLRSVSSVMRAQILTKLLVALVARGIVQHTALRRGSLFIAGSYTKTQTGES